MGIFIWLNQRLCSLGGMDIDLWDKTPSNEKRKFSLSSVSNVFTSAISASAMGYTFYAINKDMPLAFIISISIFWFCFCVFLNAALVGSIKRKKEAKNFFSALGSLFVRIVISVFISLGTSTALQLPIFKDSFDYYRRKQELIANQSLQEMNSSRSHEQEAMRTRINAVDEEIQAWHIKQSALFASDPILSDYISQRETLVTRLDSMTAQYNDLNRISGDRISAAQRSIAAIVNELNNLDSDSRTADVTLRQRELNGQRASFNAVITHENGERNRRNLEITNLQQRIEAVQEDISQRRQQIDADNRERSRELSLKREAAVAAFTKADVENTTFIAENNQASFSTFSKDSLINNLNTLRFVQSLKDDPTATFEERETAKNIVRIRYLIMALFLITDLAPMTILMFYKPGVYELLKEAEAESHESICELEKQQKIAEKELEIKATTKFNKRKIESQISFNEIENLPKQADDFYALITGFREKTMNKVYDTHKSKFKDPLEFELADTASIIKNVFENTQNMATKMFESMQTNDLMSFTKKTNGDMFADKKTGHPTQPYSSAHENSA